jgi:hypothetical protein
MNKSLKRLLSKKFFTVGKNNTANFRQSTFTPSDFNIMTLGCSNAYGQGLKDEEVFDFIIKQEIEKDYNIKVSNWNLGLPGRGPDHCKIIFNEWAPKLKPNLAIFWWPCINRSFIFNKITNEFGGIKENDNFVTESYIKYISTDEQDIYNWYYNCYLLVENIAKVMDIKLLHIKPLYDGNHFDLSEILDDYIDEFNFLPDNIITIIDRVSDTDGHAGKKSHEQSGKNIYKFLKDKGYFDEI